MSSGAIENPRRRLASVWIVSTAARSSVMLPMLLGVRVAQLVGSPSAIAGLSAILFVAGLSGFMADNQVIGRSLPNGKPKHGSLMIPFTGILGGTVWALVGGPIALAPVLSCACALQPIVSMRRAEAIERGIVAVPYTANVLRNISISAVWASSLHPSVPNWLAPTLIACGLLMGSVAELLYISLSHDRSRQRTNSASEQSEPGWHTAGFAMHTAWPLAFRVVISHSAGVAILADFELTDRMAYLAVSGVLGGVGPEIQRTLSRRTGQPHAIKSRTIHTIYGALFAISISTALTTQVLLINKAQYLDLLDAASIGTAAALGGTTTIAMRIKMAKAKLSPHVWRFMTLWPLPTIATSTFLFISSKNIALSVIPTVAYLLGIHRRLTHDQHSQ